MKVCFETFGCRLNKAEALQMEADYLAEGWETTKSHADANLIVVRGCSVTSRAQRECERLIDHLKRHYPTTQLRVCGCLSNTTPDLKPQTSNLKLQTALPTRTARAYLKVQDGCAGKCTFCIVPKFRGESRSEDFTSVLDKAKRFIDAGYHEIVVTGCNLSLYCSQGKRLPDLLSALADLTPATLQPSTLQPFNRSTFQPFNPSTLQPFNLLPVASASDQSNPAPARSRPSMRWPSIRTSADSSISPSNPDPNRC